MSDDAASNAVLGRRGRDWGERMQEIDWSGCNLVEIVPGKVSGAPLIKGTRLPVQALLENYDDGLSLAEIVEQFPGVTEQQIQEVVDYARRHARRTQGPRVTNFARP